MKYALRQRKRKAKNCGRRKSSGYSPGHVITAGTTFRKEKKGENPHPFYGKIYACDILAVQGVSKKVLLAGKRPPSRKPIIIPYQGRPSISSISKAMLENAEKKRIEGLPGAVKVSLMERAARKLWEWWPWPEYCASQQIQRNGKNPAGVKKT